jgi:hypothetical protein
MTNENDQFQLWLVDMNDAIERFRKSVPPDLAARLDFPPGPLCDAEGHALAKYPTAGDIKQPSEAAVVDGVARYGGEVFRKQLGGKRLIDFTDKTNVFHGLAQLAGMAGQETQTCPLTLVTASMDRRTGKFMRTRRRQRNKCGWSLRAKVRTAEPSIAEPLV